MGPLTLLLIGSAAGGGKSILDILGRKSDKKLQSKTTRWSPWTGMKAPEPRKVDVIGNILQGGMMGATIGKNLGGMQQAQNLKTLKALEQFEANKPMGWDGLMTA